MSCEHAPVSLSHHVLSTVLLGAIAAHSSDIQVVSGICWVHDTRRAGHNERRVLIERVALFPESEQSCSVYVKCVAYSVYGGISIFVFDLCLVCDW